jgi:hypothetical protein
MGGPACTHDDSLPLTLHYIRGVKGQAVGKRDLTLEFVGDTRFIWVGRTVNRAGLRHFPRWIIKEGLASAVLIPSTS